MSAQVIPFRQSRRPLPVMALRPHQRTAYLARGFTELLTKWESGFLETIAASPAITPRQLEVLRGIEYKIESARK